MSQVEELPDTTVDERRRRLATDAGLRIVGYRRASPFSLGIRSSEAHEIKSSTTHFFLCA